MGDEERGEWRVSKPFFNFALEFRVSRTLTLD